MLGGLREVVLVLAIVAPLGGTAAAADRADGAPRADGDLAEADPSDADPSGGDPSDGDPSETASAGTGSVADLVVPLRTVRGRMVPIAARAREARELRLVPDGDPGRLPATPPHSGGSNITGTAFVGWRGREGETTGAAAMLSPGGTAFVRIAAEATPRSEGGAARFAWGAGFEDARAGTFFAHVEDRGPVRPEAGFTLRTAELSAGYKLPLLCGGPLCLAPTAFATLPFSGGPYVGGRTTLALGRTWYAAAGIGRTVPGVLDARGDTRRWRLQYGFGRWDAQPGTLFVAYQDELAVSAFTGLGARRPADRQGKGVVTAGVTWAH